MTTSGARTKRAFVCLTGIDITDRLITPLIAMLRDPVFLLTALIRSLVTTLYKDSCARPFLTSFVRYSSLEIPFYSCSNDTVTVAALKLFGIDAMQTLALDAYQYIHAERKKGKGRNIERETSRRTFCARFSNLRQISTD